MINKSNNEEQIILYMHAGSGNHGCEAIVNSVCHMLSRKPLVITNSEAEDRKYSLASSPEAELCDLAEEKQFYGHKLTHLFYYVWRKFRKDPESFMRYRYQAVFDKPLSRKNGKNHYPLAISIGGDNYCYDVMIKDLVLVNRAFHERGTQTVLLGCSIEPELFQRKDLKDR